MAGDDKPQQLASQTSLAGMQQQQQQAFQASLLQQQQQPAGLSGDTTARQQLLLEALQIEQRGAGASSVSANNQELSRWVAACLTAGSQAACLADCALSGHHARVSPHRLRQDMEAQAAVLRQAVERQDRQVAALRATAAAAEADSMAAKAELQQVCVCVVAQRTAVCHDLAGLSSLLAFAVCPAASPLTHTRPHTHTNNR
jgi:hypothetical protein